MLLGYYSDASIIINTNNMWACTQCEKEFSLKSNATRHFSTMHMGNQAEIRDISCRNFNKMFYFSKISKKHVLGNWLKYHCTLVQRWSTSKVANVLS